MSPRSDQRGIVLPTAVMLFLIILWLAATLSVLTLNSLATSRSLTHSSRARMALDAGLELAVQEINNYPDTYSDIPETTFYTEPSGKYKITYEVDIENSPGALADIERSALGTGRVYIPASSSTPDIERKAKIFVLVSHLPFQHSVQTGSGPFYMYGNAGIDATGQSIYTNNFIYMQNNAAELFGDLFVVGFRNDGVGYDGCPLSRSGSITGTDLHISSDPSVQEPAACGVNQVFDNVLKDDPPTKPLPTVPDGEMDEITVDNGSCTLPSGSFPKEFPSRHYPDNDFAGTTNGCNITLQKNRTYTFDGNVHIRGDFDATQATLSTGLSGSDPIYLIVEGRVIFDKTTVGGTRPIVAVSNSTCDAQYVDCDSVAGVLEPDLQNVKDNDSAIEITGNNLSLNAYFLASEGSITFSGSMVSGGLGALAGQAVVMNGSGTNTFANSYPNLGGNGTWRVHKYQRIFD